MSDFQQNLETLFVMSGCSTKAEFAQRVGIGRTTMSRLFSGTAQPTPRHLAKIAGHYSIRESDLLLENSMFRVIMNDYSSRSNLMLLSFRSIKANAEKFETTCDAYKGQYVVYSRGKEEGAEFVASLLSIEKATKEGVQFSFINPYRDSNGAMSAFEYTGCMYPVTSYLYFYGEQKTQDYEILSLIVGMSPSPRVNVLKGIMSGIGVLREQRFIAAVPIVLVRRAKPIEDWRAALGADLGYLPEGKIPEVARRGLKHEAVIVPA